MGSLMLCLIVCGLALLACPTFGQPTQNVYAQQQQQQQPAAQSPPNGLDERIGSWPSSSSPNCFIRCSFPPSRSPHEIDVIARDMTNQIVSEVRSGQLNQQQLSQPYWFEKRVAENLDRLNREQEQARRFYGQLGWEDERLARQREQFDVQRQVFNNLNNRGQFGQNYNTQRLVQQEQTSQFQGQTPPNQVYVAPHGSIRTQHEVKQVTQQISRNPIRIQYRPSQTTREQSSRTEERVIYNAPAPVVTTHGQQYVRNEEQRQSEVVRQQQPTLQVPLPTSQTKVISNHHESRETIRSQPPTQPIPVPTTTTRREYHKSEQRIERVHQRPRLFVPRTHVTRNRTIIQNNSEVRRQPTQVPVVVNNNNQEYRRQEYQESRSSNQVKPIVVQVRQPTSTRQSIQTESRSETHLPPTRVIRPAQERDEFYRREQQQVTYDRRVPTTTQRPVLVFTDKPVRSEHRHSIYRHSEQTSDGIVPNYSPRVTLEQNMDLLEQRHDRTYVQTPVVQPPITCNMTRRIEDLRLDLQRYNIQPFTLVQLNNTVNSGFFREGNTLYVYNRGSQHFEPTGQTTTSNTVTTITESRHLEPLTERPYERLSQSEYEQRWTQLNTELQHLGYRGVQSDMLVEIARRGGFRHNGVKFAWVDGRIVRFESSQTDERTVIEQRPAVVVVPAPVETHHVIVETKEQEQQYRLQGLDRIIEQTRVSNFDDFERNQTLQTGVFIRGGAKYTYDKSTHEYVREVLSQREVDRIHDRIQQLLKYFGYRQTTRNETAALLDHGLFYRGGHRWVYESNSGSLTQTEQVDQLYELTQDEYQAIYEKIQQTLVQLGYDRILEQSQCNSTIVTGKFERGGIVYVFNAEQGIFIHEELSEDVYNERLRILRQLLVQLGHREISTEELHSIIYRGHFLYEGYRYEFNAAKGQYEAVAITDQEYESRLQQLQEQLQTIGYEHMSVVEYNTTIYTGVFYFNGYDWLYNYDTNVYVRSNEERAPPPVPEHREDETEYSRVTERVEVEEVPVAVPSERPIQTPGPVISTNRGDQPPQVFKDDYEEEEEVVEYEPGLGYYPVSTEQPIPQTRVIHSDNEDQPLVVDAARQAFEQQRQQQQNQYTQEQLAEVEQRREQEEQIRREQEEQIRREQEEQIRREQEEQIRREEAEQQRQYEEQLRRQQEERQAIEEQRRVQEEQHRLHEEQLRAEEEQRQRDEELRRRQEEEQQQQQVAEQERQVEERNRREERRREDELRAHEEHQRQQELDRRTSEARQEEERKRVEELVRQQNEEEEGDEGEDAYDDEEGDEGHEEGEEE